MTKSESVNWSPHLMRGEFVLWQGHPREGAGWRCLLRELGTVDGLVLIVGIVGLCPLVLVILAWPWPFLLAVLVILTGGGLLLRVLWIGWDLTAERYAITDRRCLLLRRLTRASLPHDELAPRVSRTVCGVTISLGSAEPESFADANGLGLPAGTLWMPEDGFLGDGGEMVFRTLDPEDAPIDLLHTLAAGLDPLEAVRRAAERKGQP